jgi:hypothetical protein
MSEAITEAFESEAYEAAGEAEYEGEAAGEASYEAEAGYEGEAGYEAYGEDARSDARRRRERQRQIMLARQRQAQLRRRPTPPTPRRPAAPTPSQTVRAIRADVRATDLDTQAALLRLRRELDAASRMAYRNAWVAELNTNASQILDSFHENLKPHDWARALIRGLPDIALAPGNPWKKKGLERIVFDPRLGGSVLLAGIWAVGHFRNRSQGVHDIIISPSSATVAAAAADTVTLTAYAVDQKGNPLPNPISWAPQNPAVAAVSPASGASTLVTVQAMTAGTATFIFAKVDGITRSVAVTAK